MDLCDGGHPTVTVLGLLGALSAEDVAAKAAALVPEEVGRKEEEVLSAGVRNS